MKEVYVQPQKGLIVRDPISKSILPEDTFTAVPYNSYWRRRVLDGSVILREEKKEKKENKSEYQNKEFKPGGKSK